jgi:hypothetical protein
LLSSGTVTRRTFSPIGLVPNLCCPMRFSLARFSSGSSKVPDVAHGHWPVHFIISWLAPYGSFSRNTWCQLNCRFCSYFDSLFYCSIIYTDIWSVWSQAQWGDWIRGVCSVPQHFPPRYTDGRKDCL